MSQRKTGSRRDPVVRAAALWATVITLPLAAAAGAVAFTQLKPEPSAAESTASPGATPQPRLTVPVDLAAPALAERPATVCRALLARLPTSLGELGQRPVSAGQEQNAAYGDPPVTLACGVPAPVVSPTDDVWVVNGVCWHPVEQPDGVRLTTADREVPVQVHVPRAYEQPLQWVSPLARSVADAVPPAASAPTGCSG